MIASLTRLHARRGANTCYCYTLIGNSAIVFLHTLAEITCSAWKQRACRIGNRCAGSGASSAQCSWRYYLQDNRPCVLGSHA